MRRVLVTSYMAGVGKSTVAWNLARVAASSSKVVIVETDLRKPSLARQHGLAVGPGLAELLTSQVELEEAIQAKPIAGGGNGAGGGERAVDVIVAGSNPPNPAELLESEAMGEVLAQLAERYELVVIDTAPMGVVSDAFPLLRKVDGVIVVGRVGVSTRDCAENLPEQLRRLEAPVLGMVIQRDQAAQAGEVRVRVRVLRRVWLRAGGRAGGRGRGRGGLGVGQEGFAVGLGGRRACPSRLSSNRGGSVPTTVTGHASLLPCCRSTRARRRAAASWRARFGLRTASALS